jgi:hypothetical protein
MLQIVASLMIIILTTLEVSFLFLESSTMLLEKIYSPGINYDERHDNDFLWQSYVFLPATD